MSHKRRRGGGGGRGWGDGGGEGTSVYSLRVCEGWIELAWNNGSSSGKCARVCPRIRLVVAIHENSGLRDAATTSGGDGRVAFTNASDYDAESVILFCSVLATYVRQAKEELPTSQDDEDERLYQSWECLGVATGLWHAARKLESDSSLDDATRPKIGNASPWCISQQDA